MVQLFLSMVRTHMSPTTCVAPRFRSLEEQIRQTVTSMVHYRNVYSGSVLEGQISRSYPRHVWNGRSRRLVVGGAASSDSENVGETKKKLPPVKRITRDDVTIQFARSSGAGGQNVNKVNTKVDMRLHLGNATWLDDEVADAVRRMEKKRINKDDELVIMSQRTRSQLGNIEDALVKIQEILDHAHTTTLPIEEDPKKKKQIDDQLKRGNEVRLKKKQLKGDKKKERRSGKNIKDW